MPLGPHLGVRQASEGAELPAHLVQAIAQDLGDRWARWGPFNLGEISGKSVGYICGIYIYIYINMYVCMYACMFVCMFVCMYVYVYIYIYIYVCVCVCFE